MLSVKFEGGISTIALLEKIREVINKRIQEKKKNEFTDLATIDDIENGAEYLNGKPNYSDSFIDSQTFMWNSKIGNGPESKYMNEFTSGDIKRLFIKKSDGEGTDFYYMGTFEIDNIKGTTKKNNKGVLQPICDVTLKMNESIREDILDYLQQ